MESRSFYTFTFALIFICLHARADEIGSVFFLDSSSHQYIRPRSSESERQMDLMSLSEVGAAVSVLLGFAPSASLSADSSSKLNEVLVPNPFNRPHSVFLLEVKGVEGSQNVVSSGSDSFSNAFGSRVLYDTSEVNIHVPDEGELSVVSLTESSSFNSNTEFSDKELNDFAFLLGGSYVADALKPSNGELTIPLKNGVQLKLHMSEKADKTFIASLLSLIRNVQREIDLHQDLSGNMQKPAELMTGSFNGIKALQEKYGTDVAQQGVQLFVALISKIFNSLQTAHEGKIVGVIFLIESPSSESDPILDVKITSRPSPRLLEEEKAKSSIHTAEVLLVRRTLAWLTGIILLIATLLGIYYLLYMPITRDTLLYSNVKLD